MSIKIYLKSNDESREAARGEPASSPRCSTPCEAAASRACRPGSSTRSPTRKLKAMGADLGVPRLPRLPGGAVHLGQRGRRPRHPAQGRGAQGRRHHRHRLRLLQGRLLRRLGAHRRRSARSTDEAQEAGGRRPRSRSSGRSSSACRATGCRTSAGRCRRYVGAARLLGGAPRSSATASAARCTRTRRSRTTAARATGIRLKPGLVLAIEPMVNAGAPEVEVLDDEWTAVTKDRSLSAHFEHTIAITEEGPCGAEPTVTISLAKSDNRTV